MPGVTTQSFRILVVDDDPVTLALLRDHLETDGHDVVSVESAAEAIAVLTSEPVHIVVADWLMPGMNGLELLQWVRRFDLPRQPHFVMLTANTGQERLVEAFNAGVDDFLTKPFNEVELMARLQAWTRLVSLQEEASRLTSELRHANEQLVAIAASDDLTGLANRRSAMQQLDQGIHLANRHGHALACALIDVDKFKQFNDRFGHAVGDSVLKHLAAVLKESTRGGDVCCRLGGDELLVILPHTSLDDALSWAGRFTAQLADSPLRVKGQDLKLTVSMGVAQWAHPQNAEQLLEAADRALYDAKDNGRAAICSQR
jgi:diguanylate cyclase (GGDEF)-like protein